MKTAFALVLIAAIFGLVAAQNTVIDSFEVDQDGCIVNLNAGGQTSCAESGSAAESAIFGGERDLGIVLDQAQSPSCTNVRFSSISISPTGTLNNDPSQDVGLLTLASDQSCAATAVDQYDGADGTTTRNFANTFGGRTNFGDFATSIRIRFASDISGTFTLDFFSGSASERCSATLQTVPGDSIVERTLSFASDFSQGCSFSNIRVFEINFPALLNFDVSVSVLEFISTATTGTVFVDCDCDGTFETGDIPLSGITMTLTPGSGCSATARTTTTNGQGQYSFNGLPACTYTVAASVSQFQPCNGASRSVTTNPNTVVTTTINYRQESAFDVPDNIQRTCVQDTSPASTGTATSGSTCGGNTAVDFDDTIVRGACDGEYVINRRWTDGTNSGTQVITVVDTNIGPSMSCPGPTTVDCDSSLKPAVTGRPTVSDDCTQDIDVLYTGDDVQGTCSGVTCTRNTIVTRTFTAYDDCGNEGSTCTQTITITPCASAVTCPNPANCHNASILYREGAQPVDT